MKKKIIIGSLLAVFMLIMLPSIPAVEFNTVVESNKSLILEKYQNIDLDELKEKIKGMNGEEVREQLKTSITELKQALNDPYIDIELILIILMNILAMILMEHVSILGLVGTIILSLAVIQEFMTGEEIQKCPKVHAAFVQSIFNVIMGLEHRLIKNEKLAAWIVLLTYLLNLLIYNYLLQQSAIPT